jgi:hypothetical protein
VLSAVQRALEVPSGESTTQDAGAGLTLLRSIDGAVAMALLADDPRLVPVGPRAREGLREADFGGRSC